MLGQLNNIVEQTQISGAFIMNLKADVITKLREGLRLFQRCLFNEYYFPDQGIGHRFIMYLFKMNHAMTGFTEIEFIHEIRKLAVFILNKQNRNFFKPARDFRLNKKAKMAFQSKGTV